MVKLKKGSQAAKNYMAKIRAKIGRTRTLIKSNRSIKKMPRRRRSRRYARARSFRRGHKTGLGVTGIVLGGGIYGALRSYISGAIAPLTSKIPLGNLADNIGMGVISYFAYKKGSGIIKNAGMIGLGIESAMAAADLTGSVTGAGNGGGNIF